MERFVRVNAPDFIQDSVNALSFSPDGSLLAVGTDDSLLIIYRLEDNHLMARIVTVAPVTAVLWHPSERYMVFVGGGDGSCTVHRWDGEDLEDTVNGLEIPLGLPEPGVIESFNYDIKSESLAIIVGSQLAVLQSMNDFATWTSLVLPKPGMPPGHIFPNANDQRLLPLSVHFVSGGRNLVVSYLNHGIICWDIARSSPKWHIRTRTQLGRSAIVGGSSIVVHNLGQGFDRYGLEQQRLIRHYAAPSTPETNVPLPVVAMDDKELLLGSSCGEVKVSDLSGQIVQTLHHPAKRIVQALAYCSIHGVKYIAIGASEGAPYLTIWEARRKAFKGRDSKAAVRLKTDPINTGSPTRAWGSYRLPTYAAGLSCVVLATFMAFEADGLCGRVCLLKSSSQSFPRELSALSKPSRGMGDAYDCFRSCREYTDGAAQWYHRCEFVALSFLGNLWAMLWGFAFGVIRAIAALL